jgi:sterol desaturase/sphingolipid hydroxylase (fatty acid hydroxylase superfamily)
MENLKTLELYIILGIILGFGFLEAMTGLYGSKSKRTRDDWLNEIFSFLQLGLLIKPAILFTTVLILNSFVPQYYQSIAHFPLWGLFLIVSIPDDFSQYWWHRKAHEWPWLWKWHRSHHAAKELGVLTSYRNAMLYYLFMPNIWWIGIMTFFMPYEVILFQLVIKQFIVIGAHSEIKWDRFLYKYKILNPLAWIIERTISTPSTHFMHHGKSNADGISNNDGNFSNMYFFWDILFGSAKITRKYPTVYGIENDPEDPWTAHMYYPFIKSNKIQSEINI